MMLITSNLSLLRPKSFTVELEKCTLIKDFLYMNTNQRKVF